MKTNSEHIENEFPTLDKLQGKNGFKTPEGYFDSLQDSIVELVSKEPVTKKISPFRIFAYAASIALLVGFSSVLFFGETEIPTEDEFGNLTVAEYFEDFTELDLELEEEVQFDEIALK